jgi:hypothetical protein
MRTMFWALLVLGLFSFALWIVMGSWFPKNALETALVVLYFAAPNLGTIWMLYVALRLEKHPFPFVLLAFVPFASLWYYFERFRSGKHKTRESMA